jgi:hypothetical protein
MKTKLKLFVWTGFSPDYTRGLAFAIAANESEARKEIETSRGYTVHEWGTLTVHRVDRRVAYSVAGGG